MHEKKHFNINTREAKYTLMSVGSHTVYTNVLEKLQKK